VCFYLEGFIRATTPSFAARFAYDKDSNNAILASASAPEQSGNQEIYQRIAGQSGAGVLS
jgi:hypothetical protein